MRHPSDSDSYRQRPLRHLKRLEAKLAAIQAGEMYESAHPARRARMLARLQAEIAEAELRALTAAASRLQRDNEE